MSRGKAMIGYIIQIYVCVIGMWLVILSILEVSSKDEFVLLGIPTIITALVVCITKWSANEYNKSMSDRRYLKLRLELYKKISDSYWRHMYSSMILKDFIAQFIINDVGGYNWAQDEFISRIAEDMRKRGLDEILDDEMKKGMCKMPDDQQIYGLYGRKYYTILEFQIERAQKELLQYEKDHRSKW